MYTDYNNKEADYNIDYYNTNNEEDYYPNNDTYNDGTIYKDLVFSNDSYEYEYDDFECDGKYLKIEQLCDKKKDCKSGIDEYRDTCESLSSTVLKLKQCILK